MRTCVSHFLRSSRVSPIVRGGSMRSASRSSIPGAFLLVAIIAAPVLAQENKSQNDLAGEMDSLKRRVEDLEKSNQSLENQNRELMKLLTEIKAKLDGDSTVTAGTSPRIKPASASLKSIESAATAAEISRAA